MRLGVVADDLTGAADVAGVLGAAGARARLVVGVPAGPAGGGAEAVVVALKSRSAPVGEAVAESVAAARWLLAGGAERVMLKVCSTFDSTPDGNIGPVAVALLGLLGAPGAAVCPAFPRNGRTVYMGHLFVGDRLLSESGMERHPLTPMTDPDLRRWLAPQAGEAVGHLPLADLRAGRGRERLGAERAAGRRLCVADAVEDADLLRIAEAAGGDRLLVGGSALAMGLPALMGLAGGRVAGRAVAGPGLALAGSCSGATLGQVAAHEARHPTLRVAPEEALAAGAAERAWAFLQAHRGERPLVASSAEPGAVAAAQARWGRERLAGALDALFARLGARAFAEGFEALVVAGGETSGAVAGALGAGAWDVGEEVAPGVPTLYPADGTARGVVLKSGNFGGPGFFDEALDALGAGR